MKLQHAFGAALCAACLPAAAVTTWTDWTAVGPGASGTATGTLNGNTVTYAGPVLGNSIIDGGFAAGWKPDASFIGGSSTASPSTIGDIITLSISPEPSTITFATPVTNPVVAIWSLGQPGGTATFTFDQAPTLEAGGPNVSYGGSAISVSGTTISGSEGNGVVQFAGTFSSLSFTSTSEFYYGFTVGENGVLNPVPEASTTALMALGLAGLGIFVRRQPR